MVQDRTIGCGHTISLSTQAFRVFVAENVRSIMAVHLWLRAEKKPNERRTHITPERCKDLVKAGEDARGIRFTFWRVKDSP